MYSEWPTVCSFLKLGCESGPTSSDLSQFVSNQSVRRPDQPARSHLSGRTWLPNKCRDRAETRKAEQQERGQEPGIKPGRLIHTSRIIASQTERSLSVADTTELCSLSPPSHLPSTLSSTISSSKEEWWSFLFLYCKCCSLQKLQKKGRVILPLTLKIKLSKSEVRLTSAATVAGLKCSDLLIFPQKIVDT